MPRPVGADVLIGRTLEMAAHVTYCGGLDPLLLLKTSSEHQKHPDPKVACIGDIGRTQD